jgi:hypothetical protein
VQCGATFKRDIGTPTDDPGCTRHFILQHNLARWESSLEEIAKSVAHFVMSPGSHSLQLGAAQCVQVVDSLVENMPWSARARPAPAYFSCSVERGEEKSEAKVFPKFHH